VGPETVEALTAEMFAETGLAGDAGAFRAAFTELAKI
jgi:hypothetical protein